MVLDGLKPQKSPIFRGAVVLLRTVNPSQKQQITCSDGWTEPCKDLSEVYCPKNRLFTSCLFGSCPRPNVEAQTPPQWPNDHAFCF